MKHDNEIGPGGGIGDGGGINAREADGTTMPTIVANTRPNGARGQARERPTPIAPSPAPELFDPGQVKTGTPKPSARIGGEGQSQGDTPHHDALATFSETRPNGARGRAKPVAASNAVKPAPNTNGAVSDDGTGGEGQNKSEPLAPTALATPTRPNGARKRAKSATASSVAQPASEPLGPVSDVGTGGDGQSRNGSRESAAIAAPNDRIVLTDPRQVDMTTLGRDDMRERKLPPDHAINTAPKPKRRAKASPAPDRAPPVSGEGQPLVAPNAIVTELVHLQKRRIYCIKEKNGSQSRIEQLIVGEIGHDGSETGRKAAFNKARTIRLRVEKGGEVQLVGDIQSHFGLAALVPLMLQSAAGREPWITLREGIEADMERLAKKLPVAPFIADVRGVGMLGLAVIQAEAGIPFAEYRTVSGLWKRMGLAVIDGRRQRRVKDKEEAIRHGYNPSRRAEMFAFLSDIMFRQQWAGERLYCSECSKPTKFKWSDEGAPVCEDCGTTATAAEVVLAHAIGPYGEVYGRRRQHTAPRVIATDNLKIGDPEKWTPMRCHNDATRVMSKSILRDIWRVSRGLPPRGLAETGEATDAV